MAKSGLRVTFESGCSRRLDSQARTNIYERTRSLTGGAAARAGKSSGGGEGTPPPAAGKVVQIGAVNFLDKNSVLAQLHAIQKKTGGLKYEVNCTVTPDGRVWLVQGAAGWVDPSLIPASLTGSYAYHNHPDEKTNFSFSAEDVRFFFESGEAYSKASDYLYEYIMERTPGTLVVSPDWVYHRFTEIYKNDVLFMSYYHNVDVDMDGFHKVMEKLSEELGFKYERRKTKEAR